MTSLILSPVNPQAQAIARTFEKAGHGDRVKFASVQGSGLALADSLGRATAAIPITWKSHPVIPTGSLCTAAALRTLGPVKVGEVTMDPSSLRWFDKPWSLKFALDAGVDIPLSWTQAAEIPPDAGPIFYKPGLEGAVGWRGAVSSASHLPREVKAASSGYVLQEKIEGRQVRSYGFIADRGCVVFGCALLERVSFPPDGGGAVVMDLIEDVRVAEAAARLVSASNYSGWGLAEFKLCPRTDRLVLMEINPKFWASVELVLRTQPVFNKLLFQLETKAEPITSLWWPGRMAKLGIDHWPFSLREAAGSTLGEERISLSQLLSALFPDQVQSSYSAFAKKWRSRPNGSDDKSGLSKAGQRAPHGK